jgi:hypothetical protein
MSPEFKALGREALYAQQAPHLLDTTDAHSHLRRLADERHCPPRAAETISRWRKMRCNTPCRVSEQTHKRSLQCLFTTKRQARIEVSWRWRPDWTQYEGVGARPRQCQYMSAAKTELKARIAESRNLSFTPLYRRYSPDSQNSVIPAGSCVFRVRRRHVEIRLSAPTHQHRRPPTGTHIEGAEP